MEKFWWRFEILFLFFISCNYYREDICVKQTEDTFAPAVTSLYINAKGIDKSEKAQEQVIFQWEKKSNQIVAM